MECVGHMTDHLAWPGTLMRHAIRITSVLKYKFRWAKTFEDLATKRNWAKNLLTITRNLERKTGYLIVHWGYRAKTS